MKKIFCFLAFALACISVRGQQDPIYSQYMLNPFAINPAYAGSNGMFNAFLQYRTQWAGIESNPKTVNFNSNMAVYQNRAGAGVMFIQDQLGDQKQTEMNAAFAYHLSLKTSTLSFGMQAGMIRYANDPSMLTIRDPGDPSFNQFSETQFNTGFGLLLKSDRYLVGLSVPRMLPATVSQGGQTITLYDRHFYLQASYLIFISPDLRFKPAVLLRGRSASAYTVDLNTLFTYKEDYTLGVFTRNFSSFGGIAQVSFGLFRLGYTFELPQGSSGLQFPSHEVSIGISTALLSFHDKVVKTY